MSLPGSFTRAIIDELVRTSRARDASHAIRMRAGELISLFVSTFGEPERPIDIEALASLRGIQRSDEAMVQLIMVFAQLERKMTAERTFSIMRDRVERGLWNGGHILGYQSKSCEPGQLEIDEDAAQIVRQIFDAFEELGSTGAVTRMLSDKGIRYPSYATRFGKQRGGNLIANQKVTGIPVWCVQVTTKLPRLGSNQGHAD